MLFVFSGVSAQGPGNKEGSRKEKIRALKVSFITQELSLTEKEGELFWPIYDKYEVKRMALRKSHKAMRDKFKGRDVEELSDLEAKELLDAEMKFRQDKLALDQSFEKELLAVLPVKKVLKYYRAERNFRRQLLKKMRGGRKGRGPRGPHRGEGDDDMPPPMD